MAYATIKQLKREIFNHIKDAVDKSIINTHSQKLYKQRVHLLETNYFSPAKVPFPAKENDVVKINYKKKVFSLFFGNVNKVIESIYNFDLKGREIYFNSGEYFVFAKTKNTSPKIETNNLHYFLNENKAYFFYKFRYEMHKVPKYNNYSVKVTIEIFSFLSAPKYQAIWTHLPLSKNSIDQDIFFVKKVDQQKQKNLSKLYLDKKVNLYYMSFYFNDFSLEEITL
ncbi:MAG: hypothetical protein QXX30_00395 [Candidatus Aenigmatarchaeota archaeon]